MKPLRYSLRKLSGPWGDHHFKIISIIILGYLFTTCMAAAAADFRINTGGGQYTDANGNVWSADTGFNTGHTASTSASISNTLDDPLYQSERWDPGAAPDLTYSITVPNGDYVVNLHFAEIYSGAAFVGGRVFNVEMEGAPVINNLDIFSEAGFDAALIKTVNVTVSDGQLNIVFRHVVEDPKVSAIEILGQTSGGDTTPPSVPTGLGGTAVSTSQINLDWNDSTDTGGSGLGGYLVFRDGAQVGDIAVSNFSDTGLAAGTTYTYTVLAYDNAGNPSAESTPVDVSTLSSTPATEIRINTGGGQYTDVNGNVWSADTGFNTGHTASTSASISNTVDDPLYQSERWDPGAAPDLTYSITVPNGDYVVNLHFAEIYSGAAFVGGRVFNVEMEGAPVINNLDIFSEAGFDAALIKTVNVTVSDGQLNIVFRHVVEDPKVSAIEILGQSSGGDTTPPSVPTGLGGTAVSTSQINLNWNDSTDTGGSGLAGYRVFRDGSQVGDVAVSNFSDTGLAAGATYTYTVLAYDNAGNPSAESTPVDVSTLLSSPVTEFRINSGGGQYTDVNGNVWSADTGFNTGKTASTSASIGHTLDDTLYKTERWDPGSAPDLAYNITVPNGNYVVNLHFAEIYSGAAFVGGRIFDVEMEGALVINNLDIFSEAGFQTALIKTVNVTVSDGQLNIVFRHVVEDPKVSAIEIFSYNPPGLPTTEDFSTSDLSNWMVMNNSGVASNWSVNGGELYQNNVVETKPGGFEQSYHKGTYAFYRNAFGIDNYHLSVDFTPLPDDFIPGSNLDGNDVGVMFCYLNELNYYRVSMSQRYGFTRFEKVVDGQFTTLAVNSRGYYENTTYQLAIDINGSVIQVLLDGEPLFATDDTSLRGGSVALYSQDDVKFDNVVLSADSSQPMITISDPLAYSIATTDLNTLNVSALATNVPAGGFVEFLLDGGHAVTDSNPPYQVTFSNVSQGEHVVAAILRNSGNTELDRDTNQNVGVQGNYIVFVGDSIHHGFGDHAGVRETLDGRTISARGAEAKLNDLLTSTEGIPQIVFNEGIGGDKSSDTLNLRIDSILERHPGANIVVTLLGTNDSNASVSLSQYTNNMQTLINVVLADGKEVWVARILPTFNTSDWTPDTARNNIIQSYNQAIDGSAATPLTGHNLGPDLYNFFLTRSALMDDGLHPNANGHEAIAYLWHNSLDAATPLVLPSNLLNP